MAHGWQNPQLKRSLACSGSHLATSADVWESQFWQQDLIWRFDMFFVCLFVCFYNFNCLAPPCSMWDLISSLTRDQTWVPCIGRVESYPLSSREVPKGLLVLRWVLKGKFGKLEEMGKIFLLVSWRIKVVLSFQVFDKSAISPLKPPGIPPD